MRDMQVVAQARPSPATLCARAALKPCPACLHVRLQVMSGNSLPPELYAVTCLDSVKHNPSKSPPFVAFLQVMSGDSLPPELYAVICAFNADLLSQSLGDRTMLVQRLVELVRVSKLFFM